MYLDDALNDYLKTLENRKAECELKITEWSKEAEDWFEQDEEMEELCQNNANLWRIKLSTIDFAIRSFKNIVIAQA